MSLEQRLERGELVHFAECPFALPSPEDRNFLLEQKLEGEKEIVFDPAEHHARGFCRAGDDPSLRLTHLMGSMTQHAHAWLAETFPVYASGWQPDLIRVHVEEEVTRRLRFMARNDLLHLDALFSRPTQGRRILRLFVNLHPTDERVWATSDKLEEILARFGASAGLPDATGETWFERGARLFRTQPQGLSETDQFMNRLHRHLKSSDEFQERSSKRIWKFAPGSAWLLFTDGLSHAELRGRGELDVTMMIAAETLACPEKSPARLLVSRAARSAKAA